MRKNIRRFVALACFAVALSGAVFAQDLPKAQYPVRCQLDAKR